MLFPSTVFLFLFLPSLVVVYFVSPKKLKNIVLLLGSLFFYAWGETFYILLLIVSIFINYGFGLWINTYQGSKAKKILLLGVTVNLALLASYKYANFITDNLSALLGLFGLETINLEPVHLPIGISFYTFQALSYLIDVYRKTSAPQKNLLNLALYISLFPQLIAGPIVRYHDVDTQINSRTTSINDLYIGLHRFILGLSKKIIIANPMAMVADDIFSMPASEISMSMAWLGIFAYSMQIFFDFSAYSDMAIGLGRIFGFRFLENFNYPYISRSIQEFWRRWHISLSSWFRDYLYIPLGGNRLGEKRTYFNLVMVFFLCGLWHGAAWNFVVWGLFHGCFLIIERRWLAKKLTTLWRPFSHIYCILVFMVGWVFFRAESLGEAFSYLNAMAGFNGMTSTIGDALYYFNVEFIVVSFFAVIFSTPIWRIVSDKLLSSQEGFSAVLKVSLNSLLLMTLSVVCVFYIAANTYNPFIYFRF